MKKLILVILALTAVLSAQEYTRGVGIYPGDPKENFAATLVPDTETYRNLALHRPAFQSSAYDYNLTAQLVTDGIRETRLPRWVSGSYSQKGELIKSEREHLVDSNGVSQVEIPATGGWAQVHLEGGETALEFDRVDVLVRPQSGEPQPQAWTCMVLGSDDGQTWNELGRTTKSDVLANKNWFMPFIVKTSVPFTAPSRNRYYRVQLEGSKVNKWGVGDLLFFNKGERVQVGGPHNFTSAWKAAGSGEEWVYVDLGAVCNFDRIALFWIRRPAEGAMQISDDAKNWQTLQPLSAGGTANDDLKLAQPAHARYVRVIMSKAASPDGYILSELEVYGRGGLVPLAHPPAAAQADGLLKLSGGNWRLQRDSLVTASGESISGADFSDKDWLPATVPGTILSSYWDDGAVADPNYGNNQVLISDSFFYADFWYRDQFAIPQPTPGRHVWLNFDGINWKADVFFNGQKLGSIDGGFMRGRFDVTKLLQKGAPNILAVLVKKNPNPGSVKEKTFLTPDWNGGALGADNPTYHASIGWDWIPTIRGRNTGIWGDVYVTTSGPVTVEKPFVSSALPLPDTKSADVGIEITLRNHESKAVAGMLRGSFGTVEFSKRVTAPANSALTVTFDPSTTPGLRLQNPQLWWPAGYGDPNLYDVKVSFETSPGIVSDSKSLRTGVRQFTYSEDGGTLKMWVNGRRFVPRGGNWGFSESMLRYRAREYDAAMRYHRDMNFTMVRDWVGQIGDEAFYEAADKYGIVIWQDFWLANPWDGPDPDDNEMFLRNATDLVERIRNHPSIGLYCGRNEGFPPKPLETGLRALLGKEHPGLHYIPNSAFELVSGGGPYHAQSRKFYFQQRATTKIHSELGMPNIVTMDSLKQMMPEEDMWPQGDMWGLHDLSSSGAMNGASYRELIEKSYGSARNATEWVELAQFENYDGYRAMFEAQSKNRMGMLLWMSHPSWPSFVWQTYDYYLEPTAAYFGSKKASEPLHIQWNPLTDDVEVVNYSGGNSPGLTAEVEIRNSDGSVHWRKSAILDSAEDGVATPIKMEYPAGLTPVHFIRLKLTRGQDVVSENFYWHGLEENNYKALRDLAKAKLEATTKVERQGSAWTLVTTLKNVSQQPALMVRVKALRDKSGDRILPAIFSDNYIALMPGEQHSIKTSLENADARGETPRIVVEGFNLETVVEK